LVDTYDGEEIEPVLAVSLFDPATLTDTMGCGRTFAAANPERNVGVYLWYADSSVAIPPSPGTLPGLAWEGELHVGSDLFSHLCDDTIDVDEPQEVVNERWPLEAAVFTYVAPTSECNNSSTEATLEGVVATTPAGPIDLGDLTLTSYLGCYSG
jgi:hypothetical protein